MSCFLYALGALAQTLVAADSTFVGTYYCEETKLQIVLNLQEENLEVPDYAFLGKVCGYMRGGCYGTWFLLSHKLSADKKSVVLRFTNDIGSDTQDIRFTARPDGTFLYETIGGNCIRKVGEGRKLVKMAAKMTFNKQ